MERRTVKLELLTTLAYAAGTDAANRSMRKAGRKRWSREDYNIAAATTNRLMPCTIKERGICACNACHERFLAERVQPA